MASSRSSCGSSRRSADNHHVPMRQRGTITTPPGRSPGTGWSNQAHMEITSPQSSRLRPVHRSGTYTKTFQRARAHTHAQAKVALCPPYRPSPEPSFDLFYPPPLSFLSFSFFPTCRGRTRLTTRAQSRFFSRRAHAGVMISKQPRRETV